MISSPTPYRPPMGRFSYENGPTRPSHPGSSRDLNRSWRRGDPSSTPPPSSSPSPSPSPSPPPFSSTNWRAGASSLLPEINLPSFDNVELGMVFHLPENPAPANSRIQAKLAREPQSPWNHPVVITRMWEENGEQCVSFRTCTTFKGQHIEIARKPHEQTQFLLAANHEDEVPHGTTHLAMMETGSKTFARRTYVNLRPGSEFEIEYKHLALFGHKPPMKFDSDALERILQGPPRSPCRRTWPDHRRSRSF
jgi:hypothetical protein